MPTSWQKMARKMLLNPHGREALKEYGIDVEIVGSQPIKEDKPVVVILCPSYRQAEPETQAALVEMAKSTGESGAATVYAGPPIHSSVIHWSRNWLLATQIKTKQPWTHALLTDDDMVPEPDDLRKLLSHKKDIVSALCTRRTDPAIPTMRMFNEETGNYEQIWDWPDGKLIEVDGVGTGFILVSKHAFEQVAQAYFDCMYEKERYGVSPEWVETERKKRLDYFDENYNAFWFRFLYGLGMPIEYGEDMSFCFMAKRYCGLSIYVDTSVQPGHLAPYAFGVKDFLAHREYAMEKAKKEGRYVVRREQKPFSIVILSKNMENLSRCIESIVRHEPNFPLDRIIVVDDGLEEVFPYPGIRKIEGQKPFIFARNANIGIREADGDVLLLNDDALLETDNGFTMLAANHLGITAAAVKGIVGNARQAPHGRGLRNEPDMLCFIAVFIPKDVQEKIGPLDERFVGYGYDDNDYCRRAKEAGVPLSIYDGCIVNHCLTPTFRSDPNWTDRMYENFKLYEDKYEAVKA